MKYFDDANYNNMKLNEIMKIKNKILKKNLQVIFFNKNDFQNLSMCLLQRNFYPKKLFSLSYVHILQQSTCCLHMSSNNDVITTAKGQKVKTHVNHER